MFCYQASVQRGGKNNKITLTNKQKPCRQLKVTLADGRLKKSLLSAEEQSEIRICPAGLCAVFKSTTADLAARTEVTTAPPSAPFPLSAQADSSG